MAKPKSGRTKTVARMGLGLYAWPLWASNATILPDVLNLPSGRFLHYWFVRLTPSFGKVPIWPNLYCGEDGSGPIGPPPGGPVMQPTYQMFLIYLVENFCTIGLSG